MTRSTLHRAVEQIRLWIRMPGNNPFRAVGVIAKRGFVYLVRLLRGRVPFEFGGERYEHYLHPFIIDNERTVEIPLALRRVDRHRGGRILEIGNVMSTFARFEHVVVDKYEKVHDVINEDIVDYRPDAPFDLILCISTLEHVGWDETPRDDGKIPRAMEAMRAMLAPGGEALITLPVGYNATLDRLLADNALQFDDLRYLRRVSADNRWIEVSRDDVLGVAFNHPYACANALVVGTLRKTAARPADEGRGS